VIPTERGRGRAVRGPYNEMETQTRLKPELVPLRTEMALLLSESGLRDFTRDAAVHNQYCSTTHAFRVDSPAL
jgi:hypothetical protein